MEYKLNELNTNEIEIPSDLCIEKVVVENFCCSICYNIPFKPKRCSDCKKIICHKCFQSYSSKNYNCPYCKKTLRYKELGTMAIEFFKTFNIKCKNMQCNVISNYENLFQHLSICEYTQRKATCLLCKQEILTTNKLDEIKQHLEACRNLHKEKIIKAENYFDEGNKFYNNNEYDKAIQNYDKAIELNDKESKYYNSKGLTLKSLGNYNEAIVNFDKAIEKCKDAKFYINKGNALYSLAKYEEVLKCCELGIKINPDISGFYNLKGVVFYDLNRFDEAIIHHDIAINISPYDSVCYFNKGLVLISLEKIAEAIACFDKAIQINPSDADNYFHKGYCLEQLNNLYEALQCYNKAIEINPNVASYYNNKGQVLYNLGKYNEVVDCVDKAIRIDGTNIEYRDLKSKAFLKLAIDSYNGYSGNLLSDPQEKINECINFISK
jgi:tetratricopeptide (TPR) repeat protein